MRCCEIGGRSNSPRRGEGPAAANSSESDQNTALVFPKAPLSRRDPANLALERARGNKLIGSPLEVDRLREWSDSIWFLVMWQWCQLN